MKGESQGEADAHVRDYQTIRRNRELILAAAFLRMDSEPVAGVEPFPLHGSEFAQPETIYLIPDPDTLKRIHARDPLEDLRRYFGCIKNVTA